MSVGQKDKESALETVDSLLAQASTTKRHIHKSNFSKNKALILGFLVFIVIIFVSYGFILTLR